jgi:hypothetical protein
MPNKMLISKRRALGRICPSLGKSKNYSMNICRKIKPKIKHFCFMQFIHDERSNMRVLLSQRHERSRASYMPLRPKIKEEG